MLLFHQSDITASIIYPRKDYVIFSKIWFAKNGIPEEERPGTGAVITRFLKELKTDYIDGVMLHCVTSAQWNTELSDYMLSLNKLKQEGGIRSHGLHAIHCRQWKQQCR